RIGSIEARDRNVADALRTLEQGLAIGKTDSSDAAILKELGDLHIDTSDARREMGNYQGALVDANQALDLYQRVAAARGQSAAVLQSLATAHSSVGMAESVLNRLNEGLAHFRQAASEMEQAVALEPKSNAYRRELMLAWGHVADVSGNPNLQNLGDIEGAR